MTILVTGFSSFPGAPANPTAELAEALAGRRTVAGEGVAASVLPVEWEGAWPKLRALLDEHRPRAVLLFGLHARAERLRVELTARNVRELGRADAAGGFPSGPAVGEGPQMLPARLPLGAIAAALRREAADFEWSQDAGRYLCNDTFYRLARAAEDRRLEAYGFVHVPLTDELAGVWARQNALPERCRTLPAETLLRTAAAIIEALGEPQA